MPMTASRTAFLSDEQCFWHGGGDYAFLVPVGGLVQPMIGGLPESPESKRRLLNLLKRTGLIEELDARTAAPATDEMLRSVHDAPYLSEFRRLSEAGGGELGQRTPFGPGGFGIAAVSAGLAVEALRAVLAGEAGNAYALCRPPGHHCLPARPMGFCLLANIAIAVETAFAERRAERIAVVDWDVHHGNGTEAIFWRRSDVLTISVHQENNYPSQSGGVEMRGEGEGEGYNINVPLVPGGGHDAYLYAFERIVQPALARYRPDAIVVACGFDPSGVDPLGRMMASAATFRRMTRMLMQSARELCGGRLALMHEGGYSEVHVPFCGHQVLEEMSHSAIHAPDPLEARISGQQPNQRQRAFQRGLINEMADFFLL